MPKADSIPTNPFTDFPLHQNGGPIGIAIPLAGSTQYKLCIGPFTGRRADEGSHSGKCY